MTSSGRCVGAGGEVRALCRTDCSCCPADWTFGSADGSCLPYRHVRVQDHDRRRRCGRAGAAAGFRRVLDPGTLLAVATTVAAGLSVVSPWWAVPTVITAFLARRRQGEDPSHSAGTGRSSRSRSGGRIHGARVARSGSRFVGVVVLAAMLPWFVGRFWRQYQVLIRNGWSGPSIWNENSGWSSSGARLLERAALRRTCMTYSAMTSA